tara:strand:- start:1086 stop:1640 length:555 start_codon:yes stop_codon:yes gene_type:complete
MGLFGFGGKKEKVAAAGKDDKMSLNGPANASSMKCILTAGVRGIEMDVNLSGGESVTMTHGPVTIVGENAIETYLDIKGQGMPLKPKKARHLGDQNRWIEVSSQLLDSGNKVEQVMTRMDQILGEQEFLVGPLTLADSVVAGSVLALKKQGKAPAGLANVDAWLSRVESKIPDNLRAGFMSHIN